MTQPANRPGWPRGRPRKLELAMVPYYRSRGMSARAIASKIGVSHTAVCKLLRRGNQSALPISVGEKESGNQTPILDLPPKTKRANLLCETSVDLSQAVRELERARQEIASVQTSRSGGVVEAMSGPMSRVELVRRTAAEVLERHGWRPYQASAGALGSGRPLDGSRRKPESMSARVRTEEDLEDE